jgi:acyl-CoA synthetase (AMP-forming)/AMP-acid ligase II
MSHLPPGPMIGRMMQRPLLLSDILVHADRHYGANEIVSCRLEGDVHRYTYRDLHGRARRLADALGKLGMVPGDRVATLAWNGYRHLETYFAVSGAGSVLHTINPRLHIDQVAWIANHAEDRFLLFDITFLPLVEQLRECCPAIEHFILLAERENMPPASRIPGLLCYEDLLAQGSDKFSWPTFDENTACGLCYTSGTTGNPKGVLYSHRASFLHSYASALPDAMSLSARDVVLPVVPMFHANAWGLPFSVPLTGAKLVFPGNALDGKSLYRLLESERVTFAAGVPTVWLGLLNHMNDEGLQFSTLKRTLIGGSACPPALMDAFHEKHGIEVLHAWGMTEMSPLGTVCTLQAHHLSLPRAARRAILQKQGRVVCGVDMKVVDDEGQELPWDGKTAGHLMVRGTWVARSYFGQEEEIPPDGWFATGDVATIDAEGYLQITDRSKDVVKSGGEWISTIDLENIAMSHPAVQLAACIGVPHPKWDERPLLIAVRKSGAELEREELLSFFSGKIAKWWTPDDVVFVDSLPIGPTGKILKNRIRDQFSHHSLPTA